MTVVRASREVVVGPFVAGPPPIPVGQRAKNERWSILGAFTDGFRRSTRQECLSGRPPGVEIPALFVTGGADPVGLMAPPHLMDDWVVDLRGRVSINGAGHWVQRVRPAEVNATLIEFLKELSA